MDGCPRPPHDASSPGGSGQGIGSQNAREQPLRGHGASTLATYWTEIGALDRARAESAWRWFVLRYRGFVREVLARFLGPVRADAAADEFWSYLFTGEVLQRADRARRLRPFLVGVLRNFARDWSRRHAPGPHELGDVPEPLAVDLHAEVEMSLWAQNVLRNALAEMERRWPNSAEVLRLFYGVAPSGREAGVALSITQIAERLRCQTNAVHQALHRGRDRLRRCLETELTSLVGAEEMAEEIPLILDAIGRQNPGLTHG